MKTVILVAGILGLLASCHSGNSPEEENDRELPVLPVVHPRLTDTAMEQVYTASIQAIKNVEIRSRLRGILEQLYVDEGQVVHKGQVLFRISGDELRIEQDRSQAALSSAIADAKAAEVERDRVRGLVKKNVVAKSELELSQERLNALNAKVSEARSVQRNYAKQLSYTYIHAPFDGVIDRLPLKTGSLVDEGALMTTISDLNTMYAYFEVPEAEYLSIIRSRREGIQLYADSASLLLTDGTPYPFTGKIEASESIIDPQTGSIAFRAIFPNPYRILHHNASGTLVLRKAVPHAMLIPQKAAFEVQDKNYVFVVDGDNRVHQKSFETDERVGNFYIVKSGLDLSDKVVYEGIQNLREGMRIEVRK